MSLFDELMAKPLPSKSAPVTEGVEDVTTVMTVEPVVPEVPVVAPVDPVDPVPVPVVDPVSDKVAPAAIEIKDEEEVVPVNDLTPDEERNVDDVMNAVATPLILNNDLSEEEIKEFTNSLDGEIAEQEGFITERTIVRFDKNARKAQLYEVAIAAVGREKNDPDWRKLQTVYKMERKLKARLRKKYNALAMRKVKEYLDRARKSKSGVLAKLAAKLHG